MAKKANSAQIKAKKLGKAIRAIGAIQPWIQGSTKKGSTIHINEIKKYPNPNRNVSLKIFLGILVLVISQNQMIKEKILKYHKAQGLIPSANTLPKTKEKIFDLFGSFNRIWQSQA